MARPRKFDRDKVVEQVLKRFWRSGYEGASMEQIDRDTAMNRGSIYNAFGDKRSLYLEALDYYGAQQFGAAAEIFDLAAGTTEAVTQLFGGALGRIAAEDVRKGCFVCNSAIELAPNDDEIANRVQYFLNVLTKAIQKSLDRTYPNRVLMSPSCHRILADQLTASYMGFNVMAKAGVGADVLQRLVEGAVAISTLADVKHQSNANP